MVQSPREAPSRYGEDITLVDYVFYHKFWKIVNFQRMTLPILTLLLPVHTVGRCPTIRYPNHRIVVTVTHETTL